MVVILVHWLIKPDKEQEFIARWEGMRVQVDSGLYREIFTTPETEIQSLKYHTFGLESPNYRTYINIGIWNSIEEFDRAIGKYIPEVKHQNGKQVIELEDFEFKLRERLVLKVVKTRGKDLPPADIIE
jgi:hypothetical protein